MPIQKTAVPANTWIDLGAVFPCLIYCEHDLYVAHGAAAPASTNDAILFRTTNLNNHITMGWVSADSVFVFSKVDTSVMVSRA